MSQAARGIAKFHGVKLPIAIREHRGRNDSTCTYCDVGRLFNVTLEEKASRRISEKLSASLCSPFRFKVVQISALK
jgi:hypothetical protein